MHQFRVWAPRAKLVRVKVGEQVFPLQPEEATSTPKGWWSATLDAVAENGNVDYAYLLDEDATPLPDPRSPWQPHGVHGASRLVDHARFQWSDAQWQAPPLSSGLVYEVHIGTFTAGGTFDSAIERLDALVDLGVTHVEIMPVGEFSGDRGWGYDGVDIYAPQQSYGGPDGLKRLVNACHERRLAILLDVVYNHLGPIGNYLEKFGPYFTHSHFTPWGDAFNLEEAGSTEVRRYLCDSALMWLRKYHFDGLRLDAVQAFVDRSAVHFLEQLTCEVKELEAALGKHFLVIAESDLNDPRLVTAREAGGYGLDAQWSDDFHHALIATLTDRLVGYYDDFGKLADLASALENVYVYADRYSDYRQRRHGRSPSGLPGWRFLGYSQNHDQVGNRALGERLGSLVSEGRAKIAAALVFCSPFVPMLFQGEEFNATAAFLYFTHHDDEDLGRLIFEGRRREFAAVGWKGEVLDSQAEATFERSRLDWSEPEREPHASMLAWYKALARLRRNTPSLTDGRVDLVKIRFQEVAHWIAMDRGPITIVCNLGGESLDYNAAPHARIVLASQQGVTLVGARLVLPPDAVAILTTDPIDGAG